jgi:sulfur-oxidizing protein SoxY
MALFGGTRLVGALALAFPLLQGGALAQESEEAWAVIRPQLFGERVIEDGAPVVELVAPKRADDAALVPVDLHVRRREGAPAVKAVTLVIDENPAPLAATFTFGEEPRSFDLSTRVRVNSYSFVRAIAEMTDGKLHMVKAYVKAAGGCSAPASKDMAEAKAHLGQIRFRVFSGPGSGEAQVQIRHPNYSGLQMDQLTRLYTPAWFVETVTVSRGGRPLFRMDGGISISEDPTFRFSYEPSGEPITVEAQDTEKQVFRAAFPGGPPA